MIRLSLWLRGRRIARRLTIEYISSVTGASVSMIKAVDNGARWPSEELLKKIATALGENPSNAVTRMRVERSRSIFYRGPRSEA